MVSCDEIYLISYCRVWHQIEIISMTDELTKELITINDPLILDHVDAKIQPLNQYGSNVIRLLWSPK